MENEITKLDFTLYQGIHRILKRTEDDDPHKAKALFKLIKILGYKTSQQMRDEGLYRADPFERREGKNES